MEQDTVFTYNYSAPINHEVLAIRKKYLPQEMSKLEQLKRLDHCVQTAGMTEALIVGVISCLIFGLGVCMGLGVIGGGPVPAVMTGLVGGAGMMAAYPVYYNRVSKKKSELTPKILQLTDELSKNRFQD